MIESHIGNCDPQADRATLLAWLIDADAARNAPTVKA